MAYSNLSIEDFILSILNWNLFVMLSLKASSSLKASVRLGTAFMAAAVGVATLKSETSSTSVLSVWCPTAEITGILHL